MCFPVDCATCGKKTWAGCGQHIDSVRIQCLSCAGVASADRPVPQALKPFSLEQRCKCGPEGKPKVRSTLCACDAQTGSC